MGDVQEIWGEIKLIRKDITDIKVEQARLLERDQAHERRMEHMMQEFTRHASSEQVTLANVQKKQDEHNSFVSDSMTKVLSRLSEHEGGKKTVNQIFGNWVPTLIALGGLIWAVLSLKQ